MSTCNRIELYLACPQEAAISLRVVHEWLAGYCQTPLAGFEGYLYSHRGDEAVRHILKVASSLDSLVVGESQIIAQVKNCYRLANGNESTGKTLNRLFHCAFTTSKEIYSTTSIAQRRVSIAGVAVDLAVKLIGNLLAAHTVVIGAGEMGELIIKHLQEMGCNNITVVNRTSQRAHHVAWHYQVRSAHWSCLESEVSQADVIIAAATAQDHLFGPELLARRSGKRVLIIDIAIPRNFDPAVGRLQDVHLYSVDDLGEIARENLKARQEDLDLAGHIIEDNVESFMDWFGVMDIGPRIGQMREMFQKLAREELERFLAGEANMSILQRQKMDTLTTRLTNKVVHRLINNFHTIAHDFGPEQAARLIDEVIKHQEPGR